MISPVFADESIENSYLGINVRENDYEFAFDMGTSGTYDPANARLLYKYDGAGLKPDVKSKINFKFDGVVYDMFLVPPEPEHLTKTTDEIWGVKYLTATAGADQGEDTIKFEARWKFINNPETGVNKDTMQLKFTASNTGAESHDVALRLMLDTMVLDQDGTNISVDNGFSVVRYNSSWFKTSGMISNWWDYDIPPAEGTPNLVGRGYLKDNPYGEPSTEPDIFEVASWVRVNGSEQWTLAAPKSSSVPIDENDTAVVFWWTNGQFIEADSTTVNSFDYTLAPGEAMTWITSYGINQGVLMASPTITPTCTISPTHSITPTHSVTSTITKTHTITPTWSITKTHTITPTVTETPLPCDFKYVNNFPNPFTRNTSLVYHLTCPAVVTVEIFTISGEFVFKNKQEGSYGYNRYIWNGRNNAGRPVASGNYIVKITAVIGKEKFYKLAKIACVR